MKFESKQQELRFLYALWERLMFLQEHLKAKGEFKIYASGQRV